MTININIQLFAVELQKSVDYVIKKFLEMGIVKKKEDFITYAEREIFFNHMNKNKSSVINKLTLQRKTHRTLSVSSIGGRNKQIQIEVRKKRTYIQCASQEFDAINLKNKIGSKIKNEVIPERVSSQNCLLVDKEIDNSKDSILLSKTVLKKNNRCFEFTTLQKKEQQADINHEVVKKIKRTTEITRFLSKKNKECNNKFVELMVNAPKSSHHNNELNYSSVSELKNHDRKLENEHRNRSRVRTRHRSGGSNKLVKQKRNNNHYYRLYDLDESMSNDFDHYKEKEQFCLSNRMSKSRRKQGSSSALVQSFHKPLHTIVYNIVIGSTISVAELAIKMSMKGSYVIKVMMKLGLIVTTINQILDQETAQLIVEEIGHNVILRRENELEEAIMNDRSDNNVNQGNTILLKNRAPIVTIMGHVDHGKTSLLDYIRSTKIASSEAGGITQSIGAYHINVNNGMITFIDTPGHAAFTAMRIRGAQLTDIVVLVVAADDGVMPQTIEAIQHAKAVNVPIVVAINKIDKSESNFERIQNELSKYGIISEEWGGDVQFVKISAISGKGVDNLLDAILLQSEMLELKVPHHGMANAVVIDSFVDRGCGSVVTVLVREGTLKCGDVVLCGTVYGRIRAMRDESGCNVFSVGPSIPVELLGLSGIPISGEIAVVVRDEKKAKEVAFYRQDKFRAIKLSRREKRSNLENVFVDVKNVNVVPELHIILKASTQGFVEAIRDALIKLSKSEVIIKILSSSIGDITETDAVLAMTSSNVATTLILGFNVRADLPARRIIESEGLDIRYYSVIYDLLHAVKKLTKGMLIPKYKCKIIGSAKVRNVFCSPKYGNIAGCIVVEGMIKRYKKIRVIRNNIIIYDGELESLRRFKNDVNEVKSGIECGIGIKNYNDISSGDIIEVFDVVKTENVFSKVECI